MLWSWRLEGAWAVRRALGYPRTGKGAGKQWINSNTHLFPVSVHTEFLRNAQKHLGLFEEGRGGVTCREGVSFRSTGAAALFSAAAFQRSVPQACLCLPRPPVVLLCSAWTELSTATLLASNRLWPSSATAKEVQLHQGATQGPSLGLHKPLKAPPLGPQPAMTPRGPTTTALASIRVSWSDQG